MSCSKTQQSDASEAYNISFLEDQTILSHDVASGSDIMPCN